MFPFAAAGSAGCLSAVALNKLINHLGRPLGPQSENNRKLDSDDAWLAMFGEAIIDNLVGRLEDSKPNSGQTQHREAEVSLASPTSNWMPRDPSVNYWQNEEAYVRARLHGTEFIRQDPGQRQGTEFIQETFELVQKTLAGSSRDCNPLPDCFIYDKANAKAKVASALKREVQSAISSLEDFEAKDCPWADEEARVRAKVHSQAFGNQSVAKGQSQAIGNQSVAKVQSQAFGSQGKDLMKAKVQSQASGSQCNSQGAVELSETWVRAKMRSQLHIAVHRGSLAAALQAPTLGGDFEEGLKVKFVKEKLQADLLKALKDGSLGKVLRNARSKLLRNAEPRDSASSTGSNRSPAAVLSFQAGVATVPWATFQGHLQGYLPGSRCLPGTPPSGCKGHTSAEQNGTEAPRNSWDRDSGTEASGTLRRLASGTLLDRLFGAIGQKPDDPSKGSTTASDTSDLGEPANVVHDSSPGALWECSGSSSASSSTGSATGSSSGSATCSTADLHEPATYSSSSSSSPALLSLSRSTTGDAYDQNSLTMSSRSEYEQNSLTMSSRSYPDECTSEPEMVPCLALPEPEMDVPKAFDMQADEKVAAGTVSQAQLFMQDQMHLVSSIMKYADTPREHEQAAQINALTKEVEELKARLRYTMLQGA